MKIRFGVSRILALTFVVLLFTVSLCHGGVPQMINYSGSLTNTGGTPVPTGNYSIQFKIYDVPSGGAALWAENWDATTSQITVVGGNFNVMLGFKVPIPAGFFADHPITYLGIKVGTDSEMLPRQQITSVGYAFTAGNGVPKGGVIMWSGAVNQIPDGWALCDGTNGTPNLIDRFVVGAGSKYAVATMGGEATHTLTIDEMPYHDHGGQTGQYTLWAFGSLAANGSSRQAMWASNPATLTIPGQGGGQPHNNLPPYYALAYIMKL